jgi:surface carbohydrate biosynthesis protein
MLPNVAVKPAKILYLPMEIASRELDARLLLAAIAVERGFEVVLGQKWLIERNVERMTPGIYLSKTLTIRDAKVLARAHRNGYITAAIDEEIPGLVVHDKNFWWMAPDAVRSTDLIFIPGTFKSASMREALNLSDRHVRKAANPRWDLLRKELRSVFEADVRDLQAKFGDFILVNSNLGLTNSHKGSAEEMIQGLIDQGKVDAADKTLIQDLHDIADMEHKNRGVLIELIPLIAKRFPHLKVVLRPHPSEQVDLWERWLSHCPAVEIVRQGSAIPWILASKVLLHTNCTTGVEAIALEKPAICLIQPDSPANRRYLANRVNPVVTSTADALDALGQYLAVPSACYTPDMIEHFRDSMTFDPRQMGSEQIIDQVIAIGDDQGWNDAPKGSSAWQPRTGYRWKQPDKNVRGALFPGIDVSSVTSRLATLQRLLGLKQKIQIERCGAKMILLTTRPLKTSTRIRRMVSSLFPA